MKYVFKIITFLFLLMMICTPIQAEETAEIRPDNSRLPDIQREEDWRFYLDKTIKNLRQNDMLRAFDSINRALELGPNEPNVLYMKGNLDFYAEDYESAISYYSKAIKKAGEDNYDYYKSRSISYLLSGDYEKALKDLRRIEKMYDEKMPNSNDPSIYYLISIIEAKKTGENVELPIETTVLESGYRYTYYTDNYQINNLSPGAYRIFYNNITNAIKKNPNSPAFYTTRAICASKLGMKSDYVLENLNKAIELSPNYYPAIMEKADFYVSNGQYKEAVKNYNYILNIFPKNYYLLWKTGDAYLGLDDYNNARMYYNMSLNNSSNIEYSNDDMEMYMASIKKMVDVQTKENDFKNIIASLNAIIRKFNNQRANTN